MGGISNLLRRLARKLIGAPLVLPPLPDVVQLHPLVTRILGQNPSHYTLQGTNSYLVGRADEPRILIDTTSNSAGLPTYLNLLEAELKPLTNTSPRSPISSIILTHWHPDHVGGVEAVQNLIRRISPCTDSVPVYKLPGGPCLQELKLYQGKLIPMAKEFRVSDEAVLHPIFTPGHAVDHACFTLLIDESIHCVFTGDLILGHGTTFVNDLVAYMESLQQIRRIILPSKTDFATSSHVPLLCPAHGERVPNAVGKIDEYILHRQKRIDMTAEALQASAPAFTWTKENVLLNYVYPDISPWLRIPSRNNLRQCLLWLQAHSPPTQSGSGTITVEGPRRGVNQSDVIHDATDLLREYVTKNNEAHILISEDWEWMWHPSTSF